MIALLEAHRAGLLGGAHFSRNLVAGVVVGIVAMPLAMAFAIASGATPAQGLYTAIVAGLATSLLGGTRVQISGPTGAFIAVLAGITGQYGIAGLQMATMMAGVILLVMGLARLGSVIKFIPNPVIAGFTAGIAVVIWVGQWKDFFGLHPAASGLHFHDKLMALIGAFPGFDPATTGIAALTLAIVIAGNLWFGRVPGLRRVPARSRARARSARPRPPSLYIRVSRRGRTRPMAAPRRADRASRRTRARRSTPGRRARPRPT